MFHRYKSGFNEYWSRNDGLFTLLNTVVAMDLTILRLYQARLFVLKSQFCGPYVCLYSECVQSIRYWRLGTAYHSQIQGSNSQRNVFHGKCLFINLKNMNFWN